MLLNRFWRDRRGNVALMFGLAVVPIIGAAGIAVDYGRAGAARTSMQSALDSTALMLSKEAPTLNAEQLTQKGKDYFKTAFDRPDARNVNVTVTFAALPDGGFNVKVLASADLDTTISGVLGHSKMNIGSSSEVTWGMKKLELALALDNTGSMASSNKMTELKKATRSLLNTLHKAAKKEGDVKVAIIPFATDVNVDKSNKDATWLDWTHWDNENGKCSNNDYRTKIKCEAAGKTWTANRDNWNGCVWDREQSYDVNDTAPGSVATAFQPHQADNCPTPMIGLTDIFINNAWVAADETSSDPTSVLGKKVKAMNPTGYTNVTIGMVWGWHALTKDNEPLTNASAPKNDLDKVVILLTDGTNTQNRWSSNASTIDARTRLACANAKAAGIKIYTVRVIDGNADLLRECATNPSMYYDVQNASQLSGTFTQIAKNLASLRIAK